MTARTEAIIRSSLLPSALVLGIGSYLIYHYCPSLHFAGPWLRPVITESQRWVIALLLFLQFVKISPRDFRFHRWHIAALAIQGLGFLGAALLAMKLPEGGMARILAECAMLCLICPTASAAGVITEKLGGSLAHCVAYIMLINAVGTFVIPTVIPLVRPSAELGFWAYVLRLSLRIFPVLLLPCLLAWTVRFGFPRLQRWLEGISWYAFYVWGLGLLLAMILATRALVLSGLGTGIIWAIMAVSAACCAFQFFAGKHIGKEHWLNATAGQALGQKNTGFLIWLGYTYMTPVTAVAGGFYAIWQNLFNSWQLYRLGR